MGRPGGEAVPAPNAKRAAQTSRFRSRRLAEPERALKHFAQLQVKFPALAPVDPVQCMFEILGMLELGRPKVV
jgi:hypothetical protein